MNGWKQCHFAHEDARTTAWIPAWAACIGNELQLLGMADPTAFWMILEVGNIELTEEQVRTKGRGYREFQGSTKGGGIGE